MMTPLDFVTTPHENDENIEAYKIFKALQKDLIITDGIKEYVVLSYYYSEDDKAMVIDIKEK